jgi:hypothetical protein
MESEFNAAFQLVKDLAFIAQLLPGFHIPCQKPFPILQDNTSACYLAEKPNLQGRRTRHMDVRYHYVQKQVRQLEVTFKRISTEWQVADLGTKSVDRETRERLAPMLMGGGLCFGPGRPRRLSCPQHSPPLQAPTARAKGRLRSGIHDPGVQPR